MLRGRRILSKSCITGFQCRLQTSYESFSEFDRYSSVYNLAKRLGYKDAKSAWKANPIIQGSVTPSDLRKVSEREANSQIRVRAKGYREIYMTPGQRKFLRDNKKIA